MFRIMRTPRAARETSKYFDISPKTLPSTVLPRRSTRASLARFAHTATGAENGPSELTREPTPDIEDAVATAAPRKRKRTETLTQSTPRRPTRTVKTEVKHELKAEIETDIKSEIKTETKTEHDSNNEEEPKPRPRGRVRKPARTVTDPLTGATTIEPPTDWEEIYNLVKEMRLTGPAANAAVDTMGCERLAQPHASARDRRFHTLVALMLSSQTKDTVTAEAMRRLYTELPPHAPGAPPGLNLENMLAVDPVVLNELIGKVGFHNNKTKSVRPPSPHPRFPPHRN